MISSRISQFIFSILILTAFTFAQDDREIFLVSGNVYLEDSLENEGSHAGVTITIYNLLYDPPLFVASGESNDEGAYNISVDPGYYVIEWTKDGYVPWEMGDVALAADLEVEDVYK